MIPRATTMNKMKHNSKFTSLSSRNLVGFFGRIFDIFVISQGIIYGPGWQKKLGELRYQVSMSEYKRG